MPLSLNIFIYRQLYSTERRSAGLYKVYSSSFFLHTVNFESVVHGPPPPPLVIHRPLGDILGALAVPDSPHPAPGLVRVAVNSPGVGGAPSGHSAAGGLGEINVLFVILIIRSLVLVHLIGSQNSRIHLQCFGF